MCTIRRSYVVLFFTVSILAVISVSAQDHTGYVPGKYIVKLKEGVRPTLPAFALDRGDQIVPVSALEVDVDLEGSNDWKRVYTYCSNSLSLSVSDITTTLGADNIEWIEQDSYLEFFEYPTDSLFSHQWYLHNIGQEYFSIERVPGAYNDILTVASGTVGADVALDNYYQSPTQEKNRVVVSIVDTGLDYLHPELQGRIWHNPDEIPWNNIDDDHNGLIDDTVGYDVSGDLFNFFNPVGDMDPTDHDGHGTHLAGIVGANADGRGVVGIAPTVELMGVKIRPNATSTVGAAGIVYAVNEGAQVINISWGTPFESSILHEAILFARRNGVLVCIAPGNTGDNTRFYPAAFDSTFVVAAGNSDGYETDFSTYGAHIDIVAPGQDILSLRASGTDMYSDPRVKEPFVRIIGDDSLYYLADGTSMATPVVVGAAALLLSLRPELSLNRLQELILLGADDMLDPRNQGDNLPGPDTLSGWGYINIDASIALLENGSVYITTPVNRTRHTGGIPIRIASVGDYTGGWTLEYSVGVGSVDWQWLATGDFVPADSLIYLFDDPTVEGFLNFRLTDMYGLSSQITVVHSRQNRLDLVSPSLGQEVDYTIPIIGSAYGPGFDSLAIFVQAQNSSSEWLFSSTGEFFDSLIFDWSVSGTDTGLFRILLFGYFDDGIVLDSVTISVKSAFSTGFPTSYGGPAGITPVCCDLNRDGTNEVAVATSAGLYLFRGDNGQLLPGFPFMADRDMRCVPAVYDFDGDGEDELIGTNAEGIYIVNYDGTPVFPDTLLRCYTGQIPYEYAYPNPTISKLRVASESGATPDSGLMIINKLGEILAYRFNGDPYFFGLGGLFAQFSDRISFSYGIGGGSSPFVTATNLNGDDDLEVVASYTSPYPFTGLGIFSGTDGQPAFDMDEPTIIHASYIYGTTLADLDGDDLPEIITAGFDNEGRMWIWAKTHGTNDLLGWPFQFTEVQSWIGSYPVVADLDLDGIPEILITFFEYDVAALYIFNADGTAYVERDGRPYGEAFSLPVTFGTPGVANLVGDDYPEIIFRSGYILPGTGPEQLHILDHNAVPLEGWPKKTPARVGQVFSSRFAPLVDDIDSDGLVELAIFSDGSDLLVWDFEASIDEGRNRSRFLVDNYNSGYRRFGRIVTDVNETGTRLLPTSVTLQQNYPNPFNPTTEISFTLSRKEEVEINVFNILGQQVVQLVHDDLSAGKYTVEFDGAGFASGVYFYRLTAGNTDIARKMLLVK